MTYEELLAPIEAANTWDPSLARACLDSVLDELATSGIGHLINYTEHRRGSLWVITQRPETDDEHTLRAINSKLGSFFRHTYHHDRRNDGWYWVPFPTTGTQRSGAMSRMKSCRQADILMERRVAYLLEPDQAEIDATILRLRRR